MKSQDRDYPGLWQFLMGYLDQDYLWEFGSAEAALQAAKRNSTSWRMAVVRDARRLLNGATSDEEVLRRFHNVSDIYDPASDGLTAREWINMIIRELEVP